jgi:hypothetical protein
LARTFPPGFDRQCNSIFREIKDCFIVHCGVRPKIDLHQWDDLQDTVSTSYRHVSLKILEKFPKVLEKVSFELGQQRSQFRISMQPPVENPLMTIESFNRQFQVGEKEREAVEWGWNQEPGKTMFHVVNAYTRAAQFEGLSAEASYRLKKVGGMVLGMVNRNN